MTHLIPIDRDALRILLREDVLGVVFGILLLGVAFSSLAFYRFNRKAQDPSALFFGCFAGGYGVRLLVTSGILPFLADPIPRDIWIFASSFITYLIPIPIVLFVGTTMPSWRRALRYILWFQIAFAVIGISFDIARRTPFSLGAVNNMFVLMLATAFAIAVIRNKDRSLELRVLNASGVFLCLTAFLANLGSLGMIRIPGNVELLGLLVFLSALGWLVMRRAVHRQQKLATIEKELDIARKIQASILPAKLPNTADIRVAARYLPMAEVAGDFYDFLIVDERHIGILIADVSGHGVPAALIASSVKIAISTQIDHAGDPAAVLTGMNRILRSMKTRGQFVTAAYLYLDLPNKRLRYSSAGHPPLLRMPSAPHPVQTISQNGLALGLSAAAKYTFVELDFEAGDRFLLYTDGLLETHSGGGEMFGERRLIETFESGKSQPIEEAAESLIVTVKRWRPGGAGQEDDLSAVLIEV